ncbi:MULTISPECIES: sulfate adenylyltransferase subunit CysN [Marichromatium]|uniref:Multifunctional fusion protein n=1 Tax=Marichromatium gracile TaxID=1048 RepID=A0A4R4ABP9_MARGR|nr:MULTISPECIES: sulfate adenylyltransferase subunit CysN [Marichromatium]MBK1709332.1 adenylyl-sulfate kinase [Marichromatium gracile]RNE93215.1 sulfate adenylyltransferase subunit CysN [Marichromatium sp. AB32]TCW36234.1 adenylylsulfate kinase /sulfate adenylyltransferase subunit 1 [Marichromatium gracile]
MTQTPEHAGATAEVEAYLRAQEDKTLLRFITCGSVDDGKSTLLGRLLYDCQLLFEDQLASLENDSARFGTTGSGNLDLALLVDGLAAEREQGITIDVAYRFFTTDRRKFIVADTPGHEQYTRNMATGASTAEAAVLLADARKGVLTQTRRHSYIVSLLGIRHLVLAVNKMDLVDWDRETFERISADYRAFAARLGIDAVTCIPVSALTGDNVTAASERMPWYDGPTLLGYLEGVDVERDLRAGPFRMPVQWVNRPNLDFRGFSGTVAGGEVRVGEPLVVLPAGKRSTLARIVTMDGERERAGAGEAVTLVLDDEIDVSRGDLIAGAEARPEVADQFAAHLVWMDEQPLLPGRPYLLRTATAALNAQVTEIKHKVNVNTLEQTAAKHLALNDVAVCNLALDRAVPFDPYVDNRETGAFVLVDRISNATVGCGMIDFALRRAANIHHHAMEIDKSARAAAKGQKPCVLWFTGLSGAGKSTVADLVEQRLHAMGRHTMTLDGDNVRHGLNRDLGFTAEDRVENIRRVAEVARLMVEAGLIVCVSFISPFRSERRLARERLDDGEFLEVFVDADLDTCEARDPKGLYKKARAGEIPNFTGIGSPYEPPEAPELRLDANGSDPETLAEQVVELLAARGVI